MMRRAAVVLFLCLYLFSACTRASTGRVTAIPTEMTQGLRATGTQAATKEPTATPPAVATATPSHAQTATSDAVEATGIPDEEQEAQKYRLKDIDEEEAWKVLDGLISSEKSDDDAMLNLVREMLFRFPSASRRNEMLAILASPDYFFKSKSWAKSDVFFVDLFASLLETGLNQSGQTFRFEVDEDIFRFNNVIQNQLSFHNTWLLEAVPTKNLFGKEQPGWVVEFGIGNGPPPGKNPTTMWSTYRVILALEGNEAGKYHVYPVQTNWVWVSWNEQKFSTLDLNGNGQNEVVVFSSSWGTGMSHFCAEVLDVYEWDGEHFRNLTPNVYTFANTYGGNCLEWTFEPNENDKQLMIKTGWKSGNGCSSVEPVMVVEEMYRWNDETEVFTFWKQEVKPLGPDWVINDPLCRLNWANEVGPTNDQAYQMLQSLEKEPNVYSQAEWGTAYLDFFHFKLGTWYAMRGEQAKAVQQLTQVRDDPINPEFQGASQLAGAFLSQYPSSTSSTYLACVAANSVLKFEDLWGNEWFEPNWEKMLSTWGFADRMWALGSGVEAYSGKLGRDDVRNICKLSDAFVLAVKYKVFADSNALKAWLERQGIPYTGLHEGNVDGDGDVDWLVLAGTGANQEMQLWALLRTTHGIQPVKVSNTGQNIANMPTAWKVYVPTPGMDMFNIYQWQDQMAVFQFFSADDKPVVHVVFDSQDDERYDNHFRGFEIRPSEESTGNEIYTKLEDSWAVYVWNGALQKVVKVDSPLLQQTRKIEEIEGLLFDANEPGKALEKLNAILEERFRIIEDTSYNVPPAVEPYLLYLSGVAYEMMGDETNAVKAYLEIQQDFVESPYAEIARQKIVLK